VKILILFIITALGFSYFLPDLLSTKKGNQFLSNLIYKKSGILIKSFKFSWMNAQELEDIYYTQNGIKISVNKISYQDRAYKLENFSIASGNDFFHSNLIKLAIGKEKCNIPFLTFNLNNLDVPNMNLNLGKIEWRNSKTLIDLLSLLQLKLNISKTSVIWFQDMPLCIKNGVLKIERTDFLVDDTYQFAVWNQINLNTLKLDLKVGIPKNTLETVIGINNLPKDYTIILKLDGNIYSPSLHKSSAIKQIAALFLLKQLPLGPVPKTSEAPKPREPFPWEVKTLPSKKKPNAFPW
jgi:hypothetical protein